MQVIDANKNRQESYHATLEEKTKQVNSLQEKLKDLEDQNRSLQGKLENVCMSVAFTLFVIRFWKTNQDVTFDIIYICLFLFETLQIVATTGLKITDNFNYCSNIGNTLEVCLLKLQVLKYLFISCVTSWSVFQNLVTFV